MEFDPMRVFFDLTTVLTVACMLSIAGQAKADPEYTVRSADQIMHEIMVIPAKQIPEALLAEAQGVAIIPDVIKIGFVAGLRRGHGVVLIRDADGQWSLPQFVTLTGGSVGWQAGVQGTDVVLVFMTKKSVEGLLRGKFTVGADAAAAAGPVGRNASAATDVRLKAEILSYSRSRGLFIGLSLDGSAIEIDSEAQIAYYGAPPMQPPMRVPASAVNLRQDLVGLTPPGLGSIETATPHVAATKLPTLRQVLARNATQLNSIVDESWRKYLALPKDVFEENQPPRLEPLQTALQQYDRVAGDARYKTLVQRPEFQSTHELLREYVRQLSEGARTQLALPPPPLR
jgi:lipid-binding SYLF domain-containing protein